MTALFWHDMYNLDISSRSTSISATCNCERERDVPCCLAKSANFCFGIGSDIAIVAFLSLSSTYCVLSVYSIFRTVSTKLNWLCLSSVRLVTLLKEWISHGLECYYLICYLFSKCTLHWLSIFMVSNVIVFLRKELGFKLCKYSWHLWASYHPPSQCTWIFCLFCLCPWSIDIPDDTRAVLSITKFPSLNYFVYFRTYL